MKSVGQFFAVNCKSDLWLSVPSKNNMEKGLEYLVNQLTWPNYHDFAFS